MELSGIELNRKQPLGKGNFGIVFPGTVTKGRSLVAVKVPRTDKNVAKIVEETMFLEESIVSLKVKESTYSKNIATMLGFCPEQRAIVMEV